MNHPIVSWRALRRATATCLLASLGSNVALAQSSAPTSTERSATPKLTREPELLEFVPAEYPPSEQASKRAVAVVVDLALSAEGTVLDVRVVESAGAAFDEAALTAIRRFRFAPAEIDGVPAPIRLRYAYEFVPEPEPETVADGAPAAIAPEAAAAGPTAAATGPTEADDLEIVVRAPKLSRQVQATAVEASDARRVAGTQGDAVKIVENLPGVARASAGSGQLVVWGAAPEDTRVMLDGVEVPALYHYGGVRSIVHGDLVQRVELLPGGYGAAYGRGTAGLVKVETRDPPSDRLHGSVQLDVLDASAAVQGPVSDAVSVSVGARRGHLHSMIATIAEEDADDYFPVPHYYDGFARVRYQPSGKGWVELGGMLSHDAVSRNSASSDPNQRKEQERSLDFQRAFVRYQSEPGDGSRVTVLPWLGWDQRRLTERFGGTPVEIDQHSQSYGLRASYSGRVSTILSGSVGLDLKLTNTSAERAGSIGSPQREGDPQIFGRLPSDQVNVDEWSATQGSAAPYAEADFAPFGDVLHVLPGIRLEPMYQSISRRVPNEGSGPGIGASRADIAIEPRLSIRYTPDPRATFKVAYGRYHQPALPQDLSAVFGNPLLAPSSASHLLGGVELRVFEDLELETLAFGTATSGLSVRNPSASPRVAEALVGDGAGRSYGAQFLLRKAARGRFFGWIAYTLLRSERRDAGQENYRLFDYDQTHVLTALGSYDLGAGFDLGVRARYATGLPRTPVVGSFYDGRRGVYEPILGLKAATRIPDFAQLDVRLAKRFKWGASELELYADVQNVTNRENAEELSYSADYSEQCYISGLPILPVIGARYSY